MGLTGSALKEWVDAERVIDRDLRVQVRDEQRAKLELEERRLQAEQRVLQLKLKLQEQAASTNAGESGRPNRKSRTSLSSIVRVGMITDWRSSANPLTRPCALPQTIRKAMSQRVQGANQRPKRQSARLMQPKVKNHWVTALQQHKGHALHPVYLPLKPLPQP
ncbi:hypothetical protein MTO96_008243 [Rhipicephalus appendiculatus]